MKVQKIANYEQRKQEYIADCKNFWLKEFLPLAVIGALVAFGGMYGLLKAGITTPDLDWRLSAIIIWAGMLIAPVKMMYPDKPHPNDVLYDQALRRTVGMDDSVDQEEAAAVVQQ